MSPYCKSCGVTIPEGQDYCSMCYGDPGYGNDGYYETYLTYLAEQSIINAREYEDYEYPIDLEEEGEFDEYPD